MGLVVPSFDHDEGQNLCDCEGHCLEDGGDAELLQVFHMSANRCSPRYYGQRDQQRGR